MTFRHPLSTPAPARRRGGFTLVELLVAVTLVVLMMLLFAQIFQMAVGAMSLQKGIAENDQRGRLLTITLQRDLMARTFVDLKPFYPYEDANENGTLDANEDHNRNGALDRYDTNRLSGDEREHRRGYFSISENDPNNPRDDVLALTIDVTSQLLRDYNPNEVPQPLVGRTTMLKPPDAPADDYDSVAEREFFLGGDPDTSANPRQPPSLNQPEFDDGTIRYDSDFDQTTHTNGQGTSHYAEVCYFLRNGTLYRRVLLIREPYVSFGSPPITQPTYAKYDSTTDTYIGGQFFFPPSDPGNRNYGPSHVPPSPDVNNIHWHAANGNFWNDFDYSAFYEQPGYPYFHDLSSVNNDLDGAVGPHGYPRQLGIPYMRFGHSLNSPGGRPREYRTEDTSANGNAAGPTGFFLGEGYFGRFMMHETANPNFGYPGVVSAAQPDPFDPDTTLTDLAGANGLPDGLTDEYSDSILRRGEDILMSNVHEFDIKVWDEGRSTPPPPAQPTFRPGFYDLGHRCDRNGDGTFEGDYAAPHPDSRYGNRYDTWHPHRLLEPPSYRPIRYVPPMQNAMGLDSNDFPGEPWQDDDADGIVDYDPLTGQTDLGEWGYIGTRDEIPLRMIQIRIRYLDPNSGQMRQLTLVQNLDGHLDE